MILIIVTLIMHYWLIIMINLMMKLSNVKWVIYILLYTFFKTQWLHQSFEFVEICILVANLYEIQYITYVWLHGHHSMSIVTTAYIVQFALMVNIIIILKYNYYCCYWYIMECKLGCKIIVEIYLFMYFYLGLILLLECDYIGQVLAIAFQLQIMIFLVIIKIN